MNRQPTVRLPETSVKLSKKFTLFGVPKPLEGDAERIQRKRIDELEAIGRPRF